MRMKRVQVQLRAEAEESSRIINEINKSVRVQRITVVFGIFGVIVYTMSSINLDIEDS